MAKKPASNSTPSDLEPILGNRNHPLAGRGFHGSSLPNFIGHGVRQDVDAAGSLLSALGHDIGVVGHGIGAAIPSSAREQFHQGNKISDEALHWITGTKPGKKTTTNSGGGSGGAPSSSQEQMMAMQGAVSGALQNVMQSLFPAGIQSAYSGAVNSGISQATGAANGTNPGLQMLTAMESPQGQAAGAQAQAAGAATAGGNLQSIVGGLTGNLHNEAATNALFEQHLPGYLNAQGANDLSATYYGALANALKYEQIYQAGINSKIVPPSLAAFAAGASSTAAATTGAGSLLAGGTTNPANGPGGNQQTNPYSTTPTTT